jgi:hypothetical protein
MMKKAFILLIIPLCITVFARELPKIAVHVIAIYYCRVNNTLNSGSADQLADCALTFTGNNKTQASNAIPMIGNDFIRHLFYPKFRSCGNSSKLGMWS